MNKGRHEFEILRKNTVIDMTIYGSPFCHSSCKHAASDNSIHRVTHMPLEPFAFRKEVDTIKQLA